MKKVLALIFVFSLLFITSSCKKDWICNCTVDSSSLDAYAIESTTRQEAKRTCDRWESDYIIRGYQGTSCKINKQ